MKKNKITWFLILLLSFILLIGSTVEYNMDKEEEIKRQKNIK